MLLLKNNFFKRIIVSLLIAITLVFFCMSPYVQAAGKVKMNDGEFYYSGTTKGAYVVSEGIFSWLLSKIGEIVDFLLGLFTMGGRMVFVGWTALFEKLLTWSLQATTGVSMDMEEINTTSLEASTASSDNVTIEAIVYNQVPLFNINLFAPNVRRCVSGTGRFVIKCDQCADEKYKDTKHEGYCMMRKCECDNCKTEIEKLYTDNVVTMIKDSVKSWYYIIRITAMAAMLCVLIVVGIKMAITTVAQDKAMYKRMLVDWCVGMLLLFTIHYVMIVIINFNETMVDIIKETETGVTEVTMKEFHMDNKTNDDLEISIYEAVRTRAYDPKLINGTSGMVLYITLVFYAWRFTFVYLKRYLTIIVLTLMAPGIALAYAFQKVMSGKSASFNKWLHEYFMNVIIQTVHALLYTSFVSVSLIMSLNSISGMILAFAFMNFMLEADKTFRKIFKMSESGSLAENALDKSDPKQLMNNAKAALGFMAGNKLLNKTPIAKAVKAPWNMVKTEAVLGASQLYNKYHDSEKDLAKQEKKNNVLEAMVDDNGALAEHRKELDKILGKQTTKKKEYASFKKSFDKKEQVIKLDDEDAIDKELQDLEEQAFIAMMEGKEGAEELYNEIQNTRENFDKETNLSAADIFKAHIGRFLDKDNYYDYDASKAPTEKAIQKYMNKHGDGYAQKSTETEEEYENRRNEAIKKLSKKVQYKRKYGAFGKKEYDSSRHKMVRKQMSDLISEQLKSENLLGFTDADKKTFGELKKFAKGTFIGMGSMFVGLGTIVSNPIVGMGLLANAEINKKTEFLSGVGALDVNKDLYCVPSDKTKKYSFKRFGKGAKQNIAAVIKARAEGEKDRVVVQNVKTNHNRLYKALKLNGAGLFVAGAVGMVATVGAAPVALAAGVGAATYRAGRKIKKYGGYGHNSLFGKISKQHFSQYKKLREELVKDEIVEKAHEEKFEFEKNYLELSALMEISDNTKTKEEEKMEQMQLAIGNAVKTKDKKVVIINNDIPKEESKIIEETVAEVLVKKATGEQITKETIDSEAILDEIKKNIELKYKAIGNEEFSEIKELDKKIKISADMVVMELEGKSNNEQETINIVDDEQQFEQDKPRISIVDKVLMKEAIKEQIKGKDIKELAQLSKEEIIESIEDKKREIYNRQSANNVAEQLQDLKKSIENREAMIAGRGDELNLKRFEELDIWKEKLEFLSKQSEVLEQRKILAEGTKSSVEDIVGQIKEEIKPKDKMDILNELLRVQASGETTINTDTQTKKEKSVDDILNDLFKNTEEREKAAVLMKNVDRMRKLNIRGDNVKMKTKSSSYHKEKTLEEKLKAYQKYPNYIPTGDRAYNKGDGSRRIEEAHKEKYGPVTDIIDLINKQQRGKK